MLLIQKGKPTRRYCDRCKRAAERELCIKCRSMNSKLFAAALALQAELARRA